MNLRYAYDTDGTGRHRLDDDLVLIVEAGRDIAACERRSVGAAA